MPLRTCVPMYVLPRDGYTRQITLVQDEMPGSFVDFSVWGDGYELILSTWLKHQKVKDILVRGHAGP